jgi:hypothetical protein
MDIRPQRVGNSAHCRWLENDDAVARLATAARGACAPPGPVFHTLGRIRSAGTPPGRVANLLQPRHNLNRLDVIESTVVRA